MGEGDFAPPARKRKYDPKHAAAVKKGGKIAKKIAEESLRKHQEIDVKEAEDLLNQELASVKNHHLKSAKK